MAGCGDCGLAHGGLILACGGRGCGGCGLMGRGLRRGALWMTMVMAGKSRLLLNCITIDAIICSTGYSWVIHLTD